MYNSGTGTLGSFFACSQYLKVDSNSDIVKIVKPKLETFNLELYQVLKINLYFYVHVHVSVRKF